MNSKLAMETFDFEDFRYSKATFHDRNDNKNKSRKKKTLFLVYGEGLSIFLGMDSVYNFF